MMDKNSPLDRLRGRAEWRLALFWICVAGGVLLLAGCDGAGDPAAPEVAAVGAGAPDGAGDQDLEPQRDPVYDVPRLAVTEPQLGRWLVAGLDETMHFYVMPGRPLQFHWRGVGGLLLASKPTFRYGWDVEDVTNPDDPGWVRPPDAGGILFETEPVVFWGGRHELTIERWDGRRLLVRVVISLYAVPVLQGCPETPEVGWPRP
jgi:hypothetical protein